MALETSLPADLESIAEFGVEAWYEQFSWPITWQEFLDLEQAMQDVLTETIAEFPAYKQLLTVNFKLYLEYANFLYALLLTQRTKGQLKLSDNAYLKSCLSKQVPDQPIVAFPSLDYTVSPLRKKLRRIKRNLKDNRWKYFALWKKKHYVLAESRSAHTLKFLRRQGARISNISFFDLYRPSQSELDATQRADISKVTEFLSKQVGKKATEWHLKLNADQLHYIQGFSIDLLSKTQQALNGIDQQMKDRQLNLYIGSNSPHLSRVASLKALENSGTVSGFAHGEPMIYDWTLTSWMELSFCSHYYEYNEELAATLRRITRKYPAPNGNSCDILAADQKETGPWPEHESTEPTPESVVMLFGNVYRHAGYSSITAVFTSLQLYLELKCIKSLKKMGHKVIYKMHPDNKNKPLLKSIFEPYAEINVQRFDAENCEAEAFAFYYTGTTTLGCTLKTKKPILYFDYGISRPAPSLLTKLKDRLVFVDSIH